MASQRSGTSAGSTSCRLPGVGRRSPLRRMQGFPRASTDEQKAIVMFPACYASGTLAPTRAEIPQVVDRVLLVDDAATDTAAVSARLGVSATRPALNPGYT